MKHHRLQTDNTSQCTRKDWLHANKHNFHHQEDKGQQVEASEKISTITKMPSTTNYSLVTLKTAILTFLGGLLHTGATQGVWMSWGEQRRNKRLQ